MNNTPNMQQDLLKFLQILSEQGAEFIIVGGVAAFLHGGNRVTYDIDIVPRLDAPSWPTIIDQIWKAGGRPRIPETRDAIKDIQNVKRWMNEKGLMALTFRSPEGGIDLDLLVKESHRFDELRASSSKVEFEGCDYYVASIADLIAMKREAGRPQDLLDIEQLEAIQRRISAD